MAKIKQLQSLSRIDRVLSQKSQELLTSSPTLDISDLTTRGFGIVC